MAPIGADPTCAARGRSEAVHGWLCPRGAVLAVFIPPCPLRGALCRWVPADWRSPCTHVGASRTTTRVLGLRFRSGLQLNCRTEARLRGNPRPRTNGMPGLSIPPTDLQQQPDNNLGYSGTRKQKKNGLVIAFFFEYTRHPVDWTGGGEMCDVRRNTGEKPGIHMAQAGIFFWGIFRTPPDRRTSHIKPPSLYTY